MPRNRPRHLAVDRNDDPIVTIRPMSAHDFVGSHQNTLSKPAGEPVQSRVICAASPTADPAPLRYRRGPAVPTPRARRRPESRGTSWSYPGLPTLRIPVGERPRRDIREIAERDGAARPAVGTSGAAGSPVPHGAVGAGARAAGCQVGRDALLNNGGSRPCIVLRPSRERQRRREKREGEQDRSRHVPMMPPRQSAASRLPEARFSRSFPT